MNRRKFLETLSLPAISLLPFPQIQAHARTASATRHTPVAREDRQIATAIQTTGAMPADGHRIVEIAAIEIVEHRITGANFHSYVNPGHDSEFEAHFVHGLSREVLDYMPPFSIIAGDLAAFFGGAALIHHGTPLTLEFLKQEFSIAGQKFPPAHAVIDTLDLAIGKDFSHAFLDDLFEPAVSGAERDSLAFCEALWVARLYLGMTALQAE